MRPVYLDHNATTPIDPRVFEAMLPFLREEFGNPSSSHALGRRARDAVETARAEVAALIGAASDEILFTGGGTEASNIAIRGVARPGRKTAFITTTIEHPATDAACARLEREGHRVRRIAADADGRVSLARFEDIIDGPALVTVIHAQNEIGTLQPVADIARIARARGALIHTDAAQSAGKVKVDVNELGVDLLSIAGHKLYAPKGIGALYIRRGVMLEPLLVGAGQEQGRRPGTENVASIVALGAACRIAAEFLVTEDIRLRALSDEFLVRLQSDVPGLFLVGHRTERLPNTLNVIFPAVSGRLLLEACPDVFASTGSACHADREDPSAILLALGIAPAAALGAVRLSLGRQTTAADIERAATSLAAAWRMMTTGRRAASA